MTEHPAVVALREIANSSVGIDEKNGCQRAWMECAGKARKALPAAEARDAAYLEMLAALQTMLMVHDDNEREGRIRFAKGSYIDKAAKAARAAIAAATTEGQ